MIKQKQTEVISSGPPDDTTVVWIDTNEEPNLRKVFVNGQWVPIRSGGSGGVSDYSELTSKPKINNIELSGNLSASQLGLATSSQGTKADTAYQKPNTGIPKTDLASDVQASLDKADTALQSFTEQDPTVPSWAKQSTKPAYDYNEIGNTPDLSWYVTTSTLNSALAPYATEEYVDNELSDALSQYTPTNSLATVATTGDYNDLNNTPSNVSAFINDAGYLTQHQDISGKADAVPFIDASSVTPTTLDPNKVYQFGTLSGNTSFPQFTQITDNNVNVWCWTFTTPSTAPTITWPSGIVSWQGGSAPTINASKTYEVSVMDGLALIVEY